MEEGKKVQRKIVSRKKATGVLSKESLLKKVREESVLKDIYDGEILKKALKGGSLKEISIGMLIRQGLIPEFEHRPPTPRKDWEQEKL